jgi:hypothetical protein
MQQLTSTVAELVETHAFLFNRTSIFKTVLLLMQAVEKYKHLDGAAKKQVVISAVEGLMGADCGDAMSEILAHVIPPMIDSIIDMDKGVFRINKTSWFLSCCRST